MPSVTDKPNGKCVIRVFCGTDEFGKKIVKSKTFTPSSPNLPYSKYHKELTHFTKLFEEECQEMIQEGLLGVKNSTRIPFSAFCEKYLAIQENTLAPETLVFYKTVISEHLIPMYGKMMMEDFKVRHIQDYILFLAHKKNAKGKGFISGGTVKRYTTVLRSILTLAYKMEYIEEDISSSKRLVFPKEEEPNIEVFSKYEVEAIFEALKSEPLNVRALIEIALMTGCRRGEIVALKWSDFDLDKQTISISRSAYKISDQEVKTKLPKSRNGIRKFSIPSRLCETLKEYKEHCDRCKAMWGDNWNPEGYLFTQYDGTIMHPDSPTRQYSKFLKRHGIRHIKFHALRHTAATILLTNGCDIKTVSSRLGHGDIETTNIYLHAIQEADQKAADTLDKLFTK